MSAALFSIISALDAHHRKDRTAMTEQHGGLPPTQPCTKHTGDERALYGCVGPDPEGPPPVSLPAVHPTDGPIHEWFSLSYANYLALPRTLLQSMPIEWQQRMVACLNEMEAAFAHVPQAEAYNVEAVTVHIVNEMASDEQDRAGITEDWYRGETPPDGITDAELAEWRAKHEDPDGPTYHHDGQELDPHERVLLPAADPIPHYNRGRTYIEPRLA
ncbi:hypothetical protein [Actinacidiphila glaucinigra]|uniref:hypothetical protein n=1 Tax=Actinacidiphila glaucinigra TaxID=235986 RepID=UPI0035E14117